MEKWILKSNSQDFLSMSKSLGISEETCKIMVYRGIDTPEKIEKYLHMDITQLYSPDLLQDMDKAACIIMNKIKSKSHIRIVGDYDVDGIMSTYILLRAFKDLGANISFCIPDRIVDGYGINDSIIEKAYEDGVDTIITCDNGIAAISQINHAKELGMTVVVTDHHDIVFIEKDGKREYVLPQADAVVNPHRPKSTYPYPQICGALVAYKLVEKVYKDFDKADYEARKFIEFAGIATVCDIMPLQDENRVIVRECLNMLMRTSNIGLRELIKQTKALKNDSARLDTYHLGFIIGPCFNASGRLKTATIAIELLESEDEEKASKLASQLIELNEERKKMTEEGMERIFDQIDSKDLIDDKVLVVYDDKCHESIAGIIAGRVRERYARPAIVITKAHNMCKGSGRSIEGYNMHEELTKAKEYLEKFGGHPMAAGISLYEENITHLRDKLNENCRLTDDDLINKIVIDVVKNPGDIKLDFIDEMKLLEPYGTANDRPVFAAKKVHILKVALVGKIKKYPKLELECDGKIFQAMYFGDVDEFDNNIEMKYGQDVLNNIYNGRPNDVNISILYNPQINEYRNIKTVQIVIKAIKY